MEQLDLVAPPTHRTDAELADALEDIRRAPADHGIVALIVARPAEGKRLVLEIGELDPVVGLVGDCWSTKPSKKLGRVDPDAQITIMNIRALRALCEAAAQPLAGDNLCVDLDLSPANLPPGTRLAVGTAELEVTAVPHTGCAKFTKRFGSAATRWVNAPVGRELNLRGINAKVVRAGTVRQSDVIRKL